MCSFKLLTVELCDYGSVGRVWFIDAVMIPSLYHRHSRLTNTDFVRMLVQWVGSNLVINVDPLKSATHVVL